jgi:hypothetical protein
MGLTIKENKAGSALFYQLGEKMDYDLIVGEEEISTYCREGGLGSAFRQAWLFDNATWYALATSDLMGQRAYFRFNESVGRLAYPEGSD